MVDEAEDGPVIGERLIDILDGHCQTGQAQVAGVGPGPSSMPSITWYSTPWV